jgi:hypothetical protein
MRDPGKALSMYDDIQRRELSPTRNDEIIEQAVLTQVLVLHPTRLTILELAMKMAADCEEFTQTDAVECAVRELSRDGLLHCDCRRIWPTRTALQDFDALLGDVI